MEEEEGGKRGEKLVRWGLGARLSRPRWCPQRSSFLPLPFPLSHFLKLHSKLLHPIYNPINSDLPRSNRVKLTSTSNPSSPNVSPLQLGDS